MQQVTVTAGEEIGTVGRSPFQYQTTVPQDVAVYVYDEVLVGAGAGMEPLPDPIGASEQLPREKKDSGQQADL